MHAFLIVGQADEFIKNFDAIKIEFPLLKIADVRNLSNFTKLKVTEKTAIVIKNFHTASEEAQNALLKALEEPQENLYYILTAENIQNILPTIISRCQVIDVSSMSYIVSNDGKEKVNDFINAKTGGRLKIISAITKREEAIEFMRNIIFIEHTKMENWEVLDNALKTLRNLEANGNVGLQLTNFVINSN